MTMHSSFFRSAHRGCAARCRRSPYGFFLILCLLFAGPATQANVLIQRSIDVNGILDDWTSPTNILTNPGQFSEDASGDTCDPNNLQPGDDLDCATVQSTGRDLKLFAFTYDDDYLYMFVERYASASNITSWLFYLDLDNDQLMTATDKVLEVRWRGSNQQTNVFL